MIEMGKMRISAAGGVVAAALMLLAATAAYAQEREAKHVDIEGGPLYESLLEVGRLFDTDIIAPESVVGDRAAPPLSGRFALETALTALLDDTGLSFRRSPNGGIIIAQRQANPRRSQPRPAEAIEPPAESPAVVETIVVTGTKRNLPLQDTYTSVAVVTAEDITRQVLIDVGDFILRTPNVSTFGGLNDTSIRGVNFTGFGRVNQAAAGSVYVDGSPNSFNGNQGAFNLWDVSQIEILRGPQSTTQGRNALAGAIIVATADPEYDFGASARVRIGQEQNRQYSAMVTGPIVPDQVAFRLAADFREVDFDVIDVTTGRDTRFQEAETIRGKLLVEPNAISELRIELNAQYVNTDFGDFNLVAAPVAVGEPGFEDFDPFGNETFTFNRLEFNEVNRFIGEVGYELSDNWSLLLLGTYEDVTRDTEFGSGGISVGEDSTYSGELRATFDYGRLRGWVGAYYFDIDSSSRFTSVFPPFAFGPDPAGSLLSLAFLRSEEIVNSAAFFDLSFDLNAAWSFNVGARYDTEELTDNGNQGSITSDPPDCVLTEGALAGLPCTDIFPINNDEPIDADYDAFLPRASLTYRFDEARSLTFGIQRGYRAGGVYTRIVPGLAPSVESFEPEFLTNYELSFRSTWLDDRLTFNANLFYAEWSDQQIFVNGPSGSASDFLILNIGSSEFYGGELQLSVAATDELEFTVGLGLLETEITEFPFAVDGNGDPVNPADPRFASLAGNEFPNAPAESFSFQASYEHPGGAFASATLAYSGSRFSDVTNLPLNEVGSYTLVNTRFSYRFRRFEASVYVDNLFDERFVTLKRLGSVNLGSGLEERTGRDLKVNDPRIVGFELRVDF